MYLYIKTNIYKCMFEDWRENDGNDDNDERDWKLIISVYLSQF